jgi:CRP-like cAMP-binding protein/tetratricopeptide (TPR) repeat protein
VSGDCSEPGAAGEVTDVPVFAANVRWERLTARSFWNALGDSEREALAAAGAEQVFRPGSVLCREGDVATQVMIIDSGWVKVSVRSDGEGREQILAVRGQGDVIGERAATAQVRSATVIALDEVSAVVVPAERFTEFLRGHPRAAEVLERQVRERAREGRMRFTQSDRSSAEQQRLAWLLLELARRRGGHQHPSSATFTLPMSQQELADWAGTTSDVVSRSLKSWREAGILDRHQRPRRLTVIDIDGLAAICDPVQRAEEEAGPASGWSGAAAETSRTEGVADTESGRMRGATPDADETQGAAEHWPRPGGEQLNCSVLVTDIAGFGDPKRNDADRQLMRDALYEILRSALAVSGVPWTACYHEDRGDGVLIVLPPTFATMRLIDPLAPELADRLRQHNRRHSEVMQIRLRAALNVGPVGKDVEGLNGRAIILAARIVDAPAVRHRIEASPADLVFAVSDYVYENVVRDCSGRVDYTTFEQVEVQVKESRVPAWVYVAAHSDPPPAPAGHQVRSPAGPPGGTAHPHGLARAIGAWPGPRPAEAPLGKLPWEIRGRDGLLGELRRAFRPYPWRASRTFVITGMGGLGKSTVALKAARMARERGHHVWWVRAGDGVSLTSGMLEVLRELGAPQSVIAQVREGTRTASARAWEFLSGEHAAGRRWLLVLDGADNPAVLAGQDATTPADGTGWLRPSPTGMVIVTTRHLDPQAWGSWVALRELRPLDDEAGAEVLRDLAPQAPDPEDLEARALSARLGGLPLALHLAGSYLGSSVARWSTFADYHRALDGVELSEALDDLDEPGADSRDTVQRTWDLSLDALSAAGRPQARPLLLVLSCFAPATPIPAWLLHLPPLANLLAGSAPPVDQDAARRIVDDGLQGLASTGLIEISGGSRAAGRHAIAVHLVVADVNRSRLAAMTAADREAVYDTAVAQLEEAARGLDVASPGSWPAWRLLTVHVSAAIDLLADTLDDEILARLLGVAAAGTQALLASGRLAAAERIAQDSVAAAAFLSRDDPAAMTARASLADTLLKRGRSGEAETLYRELLADRSRILGDDHPDTLATRHELAAAIGWQGRYGEAEQLYRLVLADDDRLLGLEHRSTLAARDHLAGLIGLQGRYAEAEAIASQVLADQCRLLGDQHPDALATRQDLARIIGGRGRYAEAERMYHEVLEQRRQILGSTHPDTLATRHGLARMIGLQGRYAEAEHLCHQVLEDRRRLFGDDHPDNLATRHRLAQMLTMQGRYADAEPIFRQVLEARSQRLGDDHPDTLATRHRLARLMGRRGRYAEAFQQASQVLGGRRSILGDDHPDTLAARETLAWLMGLQGRLGEAEEMGRGVLADRRRILGDDHPDTLTTMTTLAWLTELADRYADAEHQYRDVLARRARVLGVNHPDTLTVGQDVARVLGLQHNYAKAGELTHDVLADRRRILGDDHPDTLASRAVLAWISAREGHRAEAEELYRQVLADRQRVLGADHPDTEATRSELAQLAAQP